MDNTTNTLLQARELAISPYLSHPQQSTDTQTPKPINSISQMSSNIRNTP